MNIGSRATSTTTNLDTQNGIAKPLTRGVLKPTVSKSTKSKRLADLLDCFLGQLNVHLYRIDRLECPQLSVHYWLEILPIQYIVLHNFEINKTIQNPLQEWHVWSKVGSSWQVPVECGPNETNLSLARKAVAMLTEKNLGMDASEVRKDLNQGYLTKSLFFYCQSCSPESRSKTTGWSNNILHWSMK